MSFSEITQRKRKYYQEGLEIAQRFLRTSSGGRTVLYSLAASLSVAFYYGVYPHIDQWIGAKTIPFVALVATISLGVFTFTFYRIQRNYEQRKKLARRYYDLVERLEYLVESRPLPTDVLRNSMEILTQNFRKPLDYALADLKQTTRFSSPKELRKYILGILDYSAMLLEPDPSQRKIRCGLVIENLWDPSTFIPIAVYDPNNEAYIASRYLSKEKDLPGAHLRFFHEVESQPVFQDRCKYYIEDTLAFYEQHRTEPSSPFRFHSDDQKDYLKCILSVVIYVRDKDGHRNVLGFLSFDAPSTNYIDMHRYELALPALKVGYRILGIRLASIFGDKRYIDKVWGANVDTVGNIIDNGNRSASSSRDGNAAQKDGSKAGVNTEMAGSETESTGRSEPS